MDKDLLDYCLNKVLDSSSVSYSDIRFLKKSSEQLTVKNDILVENARMSFSGIGLRVISNGAWGFSATNVLDKANLDVLVKKTVKIANASAIAQKFPVKLSKEKSYIDSWSTSIKLSPFDVPLDQKIELLSEATKSADINNDRIKDRSAFYNAWIEELLLLTTDGTSIDQNITVTGGGVSSIAVENGIMQKRSLPSTFRGNFASSGFEFFEELNLNESAEIASKQAFELLNAGSCPSMKGSVILKPNMGFFQIHESTGHAVELDRALDYEAAYAGTSFLKPGLLNEDYFYGNENVTLVADATIPKGIGSYGFDHEGIKSKKVTLIDKGRFVGYISSRDTITQIDDDQKSSGNLRAESWNNIPIIRISNVNLEPGDWKYDEIVSDTKNGVIFDTNKSWSIDNLRLNFQFASEIGWLVKNGEITKPVKNPNYQGITPEFWKSCSAVAKDHWQMFGINACGKGEPAQVMFSGHGSSPIRFDDIQIGIK